MPSTRYGSSIWVLECLALRLFFFVFDPPVSATNSEYSEVIWVVCLLIDNPSLCHSASLSLSLTLCCCGTTSLCITCMYRVSLLLRPRELNWVSLSYPWFSSPPLLISLRISLYLCHYRVPFDRSSSIINIYAGKEKKKAKKAARQEHDNKANPKPALFHSNPDNCDGLPRRFRPYSEITRFWARIYVVVVSLVFGHQPFCPWPHVSVVQPSPQLNKQQTKTK